MSPLQRACFTPMLPIEAENKVTEISKHTGVPFDVCMETLKRVQEEEVWINDIYQVNVRRGEHIVHLSIKRLDKSPITDWRHKQLIKNELVGEECEGLEIYPAESRLVDTANQFHLWCYCDPTFRIPVGWNDGRIVRDGNCGGAVQRSNMGGHNS